MSILKELLCCHEWVKINQIDNKNSVSIIKNYKCPKCKKKKQKVENKIFFK